MALGFWSWWAIGTGLLGFEVVAAGVCIWTIEELIVRLVYCDSDSGFVSSGSSILSLPTISPSFWCAKFSFISTLCSFWYIWSPIHTRHPFLFKFGVLVISNSLISSWVWESQPPKLSERWTYGAVGLQILALLTPNALTSAMCGCFSPSSKGLLET